MKISLFGKRGQHHEDYSEDFGVYRDIGEQKVLLAVMDGCTMGTESTFASMYIGKLLRKIAKNYYYLEYASQKSSSTEDLLLQVVQDLHQGLKKAKYELDLSKYELLSTVVLGVLDVKFRRASFVVIGDGLIIVDGEKHDFDQENRPDYIGYHLDEDSTTYHLKLDQKLNVEDFEDVSISTDGIYTFSKYNNSFYTQISDAEIIKDLCITGRSDFDDRFLKKKVLEIEDEFGLKPTDDLSIIRLVIDGQDNFQKVEWGIEN